MALALATIPRAASLLVVPQPPAHRLLPVVDYTGPPRSPTCLVRRRARHPRLRRDTRGTRSLAITLDVGRDVHDRHVRASLQSRRAYRRRARGVARCMARALVHPLLLGGAFACVARLAERIPASSAAGASSFVRGLLAASQRESPPLSPSSASPIHCSTVGLWREQPIGLHRRCRESVAADQALAATTCSPSKSASGARPMHGSPYDRKCSPRAPATGRSSSPVRRRPDPPLCGRRSDALPLRHTSDALAWLAETIAREPGQRRHAGHVWRLLEAAPRGETSAARGVPPNRRRPRARSASIAQELLDSLDRAAHTS